MGQQYILVLLLLCWTSSVRSFDLNSIEGLAIFNRHDELTTVLVHKTTGNIYVGAVNRLFMVNPDFKSAKTMTRGPSYDNDDCLPGTVPCNLTRPLTNNRINVLVIDYRRDYLISCGTSRQGMCQIQSTSFSFQSPEVGDPLDSTQYVAASRDSVVAFMAPSSFYSNVDVLYTAVSYDGRNERLAPPAVSSRVLYFKGNKPAWNYTVQTAHASTWIDVRPSLKDKYIINYIYGFSHAGFSYFVTTQRVSKLTTKIETRLARVCQNDSKFFSYSEIPLKCQYKDGVIYNKASAAHLSNNSDSSQLFISFLRTTTDGSHVKHDKGSVVCSFTMKDVVQAFYDSVKNCFTGSRNSKLLEHFTSGPSQCTAKDVEVSNQLCGRSNDNYYIEGLIAIPGAFVLQTRSIVSSLTLISDFSEKVLFIGTTAGELIKFAVRSRAEMLVKLQIATEDQTDKEIKRATGVSPDKKYLYILTGTKLIRFPLKSCSVYKTCEKCLTSDDPLECGWCGDRCSTLESCKNTSKFSYSVCLPIITKFSPVSGPQSGGTILTIRGRNLGSPNGGSISVSVAGSPCNVQSWSLNKVTCQITSKDNRTVGKVVAKVDDDTMYLGKYNIKGTAVSQADYKYKTATLTGINPKFGPQSGGTNISITGKNLDIGSKQLVIIDGVICPITSNEGYEINCTTGNLKSFRNTKSFIVKLDNTLLRKQGVNFVYKNDPNITELLHMTSPVSGNFTITAIGNNFGSVGQPKMEVSIVSSLSRNHYIFIQECTKVSGQRLTCKTPNITGLTISKSVTKPMDDVPIIGHVSFVMDGVVELRELSKRRTEMATLLFYPDPIFETFDSPDMTVDIDVEQRLLELKVRHLRPGYSKEDLLVIVDDNISCEVTELRLSSLTCQLPRYEDLQHKDEKRRSVQAFAGSFSFHVGYIRYKNAEKFPMLAVVSTLVGLTTIFTVVLMVIIVKRRNMKRRQKQWNDGVVVYTFGSQEQLQNRHTNYYEGLEGNRNRAAETEDNDQGGAASNVIRSKVNVSEELLELLRTEDILIEIKYIRLREVIGQGHFGCVYRGRLDLPGKQETIDVAVKTLNNRIKNGEDEVEAFLHEGLMMKDFTHPNVLTLIGVSHEEGSTPMVIIPYMQHGDLLTYIRNEEHSPTVRNLIEFGAEVADGMSYLSDLKFVHRDLAARNCMLDENMLVKVADFGLSRDIYERDYYCSDNKKAKLPVKWMSPESLEKGTYNTKTDVWSYGVLLWELMTRGVCPYPEVDNWDVIKYIKSGRRMAQPPYCPDALYTIMDSCWKENPKDRPTFRQLSEDVRGVITELVERRRKCTEPDPNLTYINCPVNPENTEQAT